nr:MAG TPA: hypothetical protein [Caudoviricetes sp.]
MNGSVTATKAACMSAVRGIITSQNSCMHIQYR